MAGSNRSPAPLNGVPPHWGTPEGDPHALAQQKLAQQTGQPQHGQLQQGQPQHGYPAQQDALSRWVPPQQAYPQQPQLQPQQPGYAPPQHAQQTHAPAPGYGYPAGQQAHQQAQPPAPQPPPYGGYSAPHDPFGQPAQAGYATQYDRYAAAPSAHQQEAYQPLAQPADPHALSYPGDPRRGADPRQGFGQGYPQSPGAGYGQPAAPATEVQNWDLAHYAPGQLPAGHAAHGAAGQGFGVPAPGNPPAQHYPAFDQAPHHDPRYAPPAQQSRPAGAPQEAAYDLDRYGQPQQQQGYAPQQGYGQQGYDAQDQADPNAEQDFAYEEEPVVEKRRGPRVMMVVGALVGAILIGGGLAKGYQMLGGGSNDAGKTPVVKADKSPAKTKPADAGGKDVAYTDKKFLNRLDGAGGASSVTSASDVVPPAPARDPEEPRKVQTVIVNKDGTISPQMQAPAQQAPVSAPSGIPGMVVDGGPQPQGRPPLRGATVAPDQQPVTPVSRQAPKVADLPLPKVKSAAVPGDAPPPPKKKAAVRDDALAPKASTATTSTTAGGNGYVAALISTKTREEALKTFANLHQTYPDLQDKVPDVREVDRGEKGLWYRLIAGPPSSKEAAGDLCKKLKGQGLKDCWVTAY